MTKAPAPRSKPPRNCAAAPGRILGSIGVVGGVAWPGRGVAGAGRAGPGPGRFRRLQPIPPGAPAPPAPAARRDAGGRGRGRDRLSGSLDNKV